jgi:hypothetical protein
MPRISLIIDRYLLPPSARKLSALRTYWETTKSTDIETPLVSKNKKEKGLSNEHCFDSKR